MIKKGDNKDTLYVIQRWTDRAPTAPLIKTLDNRKAWEESRMQLAIAWHGVNPLDQYCSYAIDNGVHPKNCSSSSFCQKMAQIFDLGIAAGYDYICLMDDDACIQNVPLMDERLHEAFADSLVGKSGPCNEYACFIKYDNVREPHLKYQTHHTASSGGSQCYRTEALIDTRDMWRPYCQEAAYTNEVPVHIFMQVMGWKMTEFYIPGFIHTRYFGTAEKVYDDAWIISHVQKIHQDAVAFWKVLPRIAYASYGASFSKFLYGQIRNCIRKAQKSGAAGEYASWDTSTTGIKALIEHCDLVPWDFDGFI